MARFIMILFFSLSGFCLLAAFNGSPSQPDILKTSKGDLKITCIGHASLMFEFDDKVIHVDPYGSVADYNLFPKADIILITHHHGDHLDVETIQKLEKEDTAIAYTDICADKLKGGIVLNNGDRKEVGGIEVEAIPAYNIEHMRGEGVPFHPKGEGNGYILTFGDKKVYVAGDTENTPEMKALRNIDAAFLPMNLPYTMTPEMVADAAKAFRPKILYPYHYGKTDTSRLIDLLENEKDIEVRIRKM